MYYYLSKENIQVGPISIEDLKKVIIDEKTQIWKDGLEGWADAETIEELKSFFENKYKKYNVKINNQIEVFTLQGLIDKKIERGTLVWFEGCPKWVQVETLPEFEEYFRTVPPPFPKKENLFQKITEEVKSTLDIGISQLNKDVPKDTPNNATEPKQQQPKTDSEESFFKKYRLPIIIIGIVLIVQAVPELVVSWRSSQTQDSKIADNAGKDFCGCIGKYDDMVFVGGHEAVFLCAASKPQVRKLYARFKNLEKDDGLLSTLDKIILKSYFTASLKVRCKDKGQEYVELIEAEANKSQHNEKKEE